MPESLEQNYYLSREELIIPTVREKINNPEENAKRYDYAISNNEYSAVVVDLDGVFVRRNEIDKNSFDALMNKTVLNSSGRVPLSIASGRTVAEIGEIILPEIHRMMKERKVEGLKEGDLLIFASNGSVGIDAATFDILYASPLNQEEVAKAQLLEEIQAILNITQRQGVLLDDEGKKRVDRAKIINDSYTYTLGFNPKKLDLVQQTGEAGTAAVEEFQRLYGTPSNLISVAQRLNRIFEEQNIALVATTSGALIDINTKGVSKDLAIQVTIQTLAKKTGKSLGEIKPECILSLGDSTLGNDEFLTQREGGFSNIEPPLPGSAFPIVINETGNQYEKVATFLKKVKLSPLTIEANPQFKLDEDYLVPPTELQQGMPNGEITDVFDITGAQKITIQEARAIMDDTSIPENVRQFFASHASVRTEGGEQVVFLRGRPYYEQLSQANSEDNYAHLTEISNMLKTFDVFNDRGLSNHEREILLCLLDHGKSYALRLLNTEVEHGFTQDNVENIHLYSEIAENFVNNYYRTLLRIGRKQLLDAQTLPIPHQLTPQEQMEFNDLMREMDQPLPIAMQTNYISEQITKTGKNYDYIVSPFYGAAELGFALQSMMEIKGIEQLPEVLSVRFSGKRAREEERQSDIFPRQLRRNIVGKSILIFDDNSGTGTTLRKLKDELGRYSPPTVDAAVVQVGTTTRVERVLKGEKTNFNRAILMPEDITYKGVQVYNLKESMRKAQQFLHHVSLHDYLYKFKLTGGEQQ